MVAILGFSHDYEGYAQSIMTAMSELCYVQSFAKSLPDGRFVVNISVPAQYESSMKEVLNHLKGLGMLNYLELIEFDWFRNPPMKAEYYDFDEGRWDFDFAGPHSENLEAVRYSPSSPTRIDFIDLLIIKQLQKNANKSLKDIADELKLNYKKLAWHHNTHVVGRNMLRGYSIRWTGTSYDFKVDKALHRKHRYIPVVLIIKDVDALNLAYVRQQINQLPFLWAEAGGKSYYAELAFPVDCLTESLIYVSEAVSKVKDKVIMLTEDQTNSISFTIAPQLFSERNRQWIFNEEELEAKFGNLMQQIRRESG